MLDVNKFDWIRKSIPILITIAFVFFFQHAVFLMTWFVAFLIPDVPSSVKQLMLYESALVKKARFDAAQVLQDEENTNGGVRRRTDRNSSVPSY